MTAKTKDVEVLEKGKVPATTNPQEAFLDLIERLATNPDADVEKIQRIMDMQEQVLKRNAKQAFNAAMGRAQAEMPTVPRDLKNSQTNSRYSAYETILKHTKPIYTAEGFSVLMYEGDTSREGNIRVCADVMHEQGHTEQRWTDVPIDDKGIKGTVNKTMPHAKKSSLSYGKGMLLCMIFNISTGDDDDGNGGGGMEYITEEQVAELKKEREARKVDGPKFLAHFEVDSLDKIPAKRFKEALSVMRAKPIPKKAEPPEREVGEEG